MTQATLIQTQPTDQPGTLQRHIKTLLDQNKHLRDRVNALEISLEHAGQDLIALERALSQQWTAPDLELPRHDTMVLMLLQRKDNTRLRKLGYIDREAEWHTLEGGHIYLPDYWRVIGWMALPPDR